MCEVAEQPRADAVPFSMGASDPKMAQDFLKTARELRADGQAGAAMLLYESSLVAISQAGDESGTQEAGELQQIQR